MIARASYPLPPFDLCCAGRCEPRPRDSGGDWRRQLLDDGRQPEVGRAGGDRVHEDARALQAHVV